MILSRQLSPMQNGHTAWEQDDPGEIAGATVISVRKAISMQDHTIINEKLRAAGLPVRIATAVVIALVLIAAWSMGGWYVTALLGVVIMTGYGEWLFLFQKKGGWDMKITGLVLCAVFCVLTALRFPAHLALMVCSLGTAVYALFSWSQIKTFEPLRQSAVMLTGLLYIPALMMPLCFMSRWEQLLVVLVPVASDVAAYFTGVLCGSHKIWPSVSPKKSVEGAVAGLAASTLIAVLLGLALGKAPVLSFALLGLIMGIMAQLGDFFESAIKRAVDVKDSSNLLPGHGGVLDRLDSISFCSGTYAAAAAICPFFA